MSIEEAIRILHPDTAREALAEIEYYHGFNGAKAVQNAVTCACLVACTELRKIVSGELIPAVHKHDGKTSDGYHTFDELYHHRAVLFATVVADHPRMSWKSKLHHDGTMYDGMFIVGLDTPYGQATYHYDVDPYWDMFQCKELECAPEFDGHTAADAIERIGKLEPVRHGRWIPEKVCSVETKFKCSECNRKIIACNDYFGRAPEFVSNIYPYCHCGAKMDLEVQDE